MSLPGRGRGHSRGFVAADWTARETLGGRTLERPSCGGFMPTAETTLFPAYSARSRRLLTSSARLDNEPNLIDGSARAVEEAKSLETELRTAVAASHEDD
jgi:hypothetical protein